MSDFKNVCKRHNLYKYLYSSYDMTDVNSAFNKIMAKSLATQLLCKLTLKVQIIVTIYKKRNISAIIRLNLPKMSQKCWQCCRRKHVIS